VASRQNQTSSAAPVKKTTDAVQPQQRSAAPTALRNDKPLHPSEVITNQPIAGDEWHRLIGRLSLQGVVRALANNCALIRRDGHVFHLTLAPVHASLRNVKVEERLQESLSSHLGEKVKLAFTIGEPREETPAAIQKRESQDRMRAAQEAIAQDKHVKTLQEMFGARVVPDSVRPLD